MAVAFLLLICPSRSRLHCHSLRKQA